MGDNYACSPMTTQVDALSDSTSNFSCHN